MKDYIILSDVCYAYKRSGFAIKGVSLKLRSGEITALTGHNGSGKTTLIKIMMGILSPDSGTVYVDGEDISKKRLPEIAKKIGFLFQNPDRQLFCASVREEILFSLRHRGVGDDMAGEEANRLLAHFSMDDKADAYPLKLSRGEMQRLALMAVLAMQPPFYILDEPSSGIGEANREKLISMLLELKEGGAGMCIVTHDKELIRRIADREIVMKDGALQ